MPVERVFEKFWLPLPGVPPAEVKLPFRIETGSFRVDKAGPYRQYFSKSFSAKPAVVCVGHVRAGTLPTPPKPSPTTKVIPPSPPVVSPVSIPTLKAPAVPPVTFPPVKIEKFEALFPVVEVKIGYFGCPEKHKVGEVEVDKPFPFRAIDRVDLLWYDENMRVVKTETIARPDIYCPMHVPPKKISAKTYSSYDEFIHAMGEFYYKLGSEAAPWGFGWIAGRILRPLPCAVDRAVEGGFRLAEELHRGTTNELLKMLGDQTKKIKSFGYDLRDKINSSLETMTTKIKEMVDKTVSDLTSKINTAYATIKGEIDAKIGEHLKKLNQELTRWAENLNKAFEAETENVRKTLRDATENIRMMEGLREGVLATPAVLREVTPIYFEIEAVPASYEWLAVGP